MGKWIVKSEARHQLDAISSKDNAASWRHFPELKLRFTYSDSAHWEDVEHVWLTCRKCGTAITANRERVEFTANGDVPTLPLWEVDEAPCANMWILKTVQSNSFWRSVSPTAQMQVSSCSSSISVPSCRTKQDLWHSLFTAVIYTWQDVKPFETAARSTSTQHCLLKMMFPYN